MRYTITYQISIWLAMITYYGIQWIVMIITDISYLKHIHLSYFLSSKYLLGRYHITFQHILPYVWLVDLKLEVISNTIGCNSHLQGSFVLKYSIIMNKLHDRLRDHTIHFVNIIVKCINWWYVYAGNKTIYLWGFLDIFMGIVVIQCSYVNENILL